MGSEVTKVENSKFNSKWENKLFVAEWLMGISFICAVVLFCIHQPWFVWANAIDTSKWGTFGDFIGGVLGTACAYISLRLLVKNLKEQEKSNDYLRESNNRSSEVSELQLVHEDISTLLESYNRIINTYKTSDDSMGQKAIKDIATEILNSYNEDNNDQIEKRIEEARKLFDAKYIIHRDSMSVHFRLLYQIFQIIWLSDIKGKKKAMLSKMLRSQFAEHELLLLRYNCLTSNGKKMRFYVNQFNLLKHLPITHLLEFKKWVKDLDDVQRNRLDSECISIRKCIKNLLLKDENKEEKQQLNYSNRYNGAITISADKKTCHFELVRNTQESSSVDITSIDNVLDKWNDEEMESFFVDFFKYIFDYSNFSQFNTIDDLEVTHDVKTEQTGKKHTIWTMVKKDKSPLVISMSQAADPQK
mgnify:FL=1